ncbi:CDP-alcohol phosphatidyltransferase family protein [Candidatus Similichlamydia epinepheli]|uniref:CDP-alcohol phosphatidyltransferase family protein n=1 Tax=Candidatus Similichlamydia epinepheli TaxID=1903953 RepID=UPI00130083C5|nr:CDP-alcohol phosphatidyltransferase family protein [Candidatus Similichlamydia epinepheli]
MSAFILRIKRSLPHLVTSSRFLCAGIILSEVDSSVKEKLFVIGFFSDGIDGFLARRWNVSSPIGALFDALADRALFYSVICHFSTSISEAHLHHLLIFPLRDVALLFYWILWAIRRSREQSSACLQRSMLSGKILTFFQAILVVALFHEFQLGWWWFFSHLSITFLTVIELARFLY